MGALVALGFVAFLIVVVATYRTIYRMLRWASCRPRPPLLLVTIDAAPHAS